MECGMYPLVRIVIVGALSLALLEGRASAKPVEEEWIANSTTAISITGDVILSPTRLRMGGANLRLRLVADVPRFVGAFGPVQARIFSVARPRNPVLLNGNTICAQPIRWIVVSHTKNGELELDAFEGREIPASLDSKGACGAFFYSRPLRSSVAS